MTSNDFTYWLQGFFEVSGAEELTKEQVQVIKNHLQLVFKKETPNVNVTPFACGGTQTPSHSDNWTISSNGNETDVKFCGNVIQEWANQIEANISKDPNYPLQSC